MSGEPKTSSNLAAAALRHVLLVALRPRTSTDSDEPELIEPGSLVGALGGFRLLCTIPLTQLPLQLVLAAGAYAVAVVPNCDKDSKHDDEDEGEARELLLRVFRDTPNHALVVTPLADPESRHRSFIIYTAQPPLPISLHVAELALAPCFSQNAMLQLLAGAAAAAAKQPMHAFDEEYIDTYFARLDAQHKAAASSKVERIFAKLMTDTQRTTLSSSSGAKKKNTRPEKRAQAVAAVKKEPPRDWIRENKTCLKIKIKRALEILGIHSKHKDYAASHKLIYAGVTFRLRNELSRPEKVSDDLLGENVSLLIETNRKLLLGD